MEKLKQKRIILFALIGVLFLTVVGTTYAYFNLTTSGNENASGITVYDAKLHLTYEGGMEITGTTIEPSSTTPIGTKTIEVTNDGTENVYYLLHWQELYNELVKQNDSSEDELYVTATCTSYTNYGKSNQAVSGTCDGFNKYIPTQSTLYTYSSGTVNDTYVLKKNISIATGITHVYSLSVYFKNESYNQNYNQNKQFYGSIGVAESVELPTAKASLSDYSWDEIKTLSDALVAGTITTSQLSTTYNINVGDTTASVSITPSGGSAESHTFRLVGINHDVDSGGTNKIGMTFEQVDVMNNLYKMKSNMTATDSWSNSDLKTTINNFEIEIDLNSLITPAKKTCVESVSSSTITYVTSKLWVMSETEIAGTQTATYAGTAEGSQYSYYKTNNEESARIKKYGTRNGSYWLRSANSWSDDWENTCFVQIDSNGNTSTTYSSYVNAGVALCFCI